jgi:ArsR family transcriptional regulator
MTRLVEGSLSLRSGGLDRGSGAGRGGGPIRFRPEESREIRPDRRYWHDECKDLTELRVQFPKIQPPIGDVLMVAKTMKGARAAVRREQESAEEGTLFSRANRNREVSEGRMPSSNQESTNRDRAIRSFVNVFALLSDETRLRILAVLMEHGERNVTDLGKDLGQSQPAVSHHLALLRVAGLIEPRRSGKNNFYSVRTEQFNELLTQLLSISGQIPRKLPIGDLTLTHQAR